MNKKSSSFKTSEFLRQKANGIITLVVLSVVLLALWLSDASTEFFQTLLSETCVLFRGPVTIFCFFCIAVLLFLVFSKYGSIRLGGKNAKPEYSMFSWLSCLFMAGCGIGIVFYCQEPILHYYSSPYIGKVPGENLAVAFSLSLFDWTINDWVQFALLGVVLAYFHYNKGKDLRLSSVLPGNTPSYIRSIIDIIMAIGVISGLTTSLGLGITQINKGFSFVFDTELNPYFLMIFIGIVAGWSVTSGLKKGVKWLSNISSVLVFVLLLSVVFMGVFSLKIYSFVEYIFNGTFLLFRNYITYNDFWNHETDEWAAANPIFFNLWFSAWAAFVSVFVAKISKGRTIREFIIGVVVFPTLFSIIWFGCFGTIGAHYIEMIYNAMSNDVPTALFLFLKSISQNGVYVILSSLILLIICLFFITSSDSASFVVSTLLSKEKHVGSKEKLFWAAVQCLVAMGLYYCGGLALVQSVSVIMGLLVIVLIVVGTYFFVIKLKDEYRNNND